MKLFDKKDQITSEISKLKLAGKSVGFVPTMGFLHDGHLSLVKKAKELCDIVIVSIFVNPTQFGANEDLDTYPSDIKSDMAKLESLGVDYLFNPKSDDMYGDNSIIKLNAGKTADVLCGKLRENHFDGVLTVVNKLFNIVRPDVAVFGKKDAQQLIIIEKMVHDLDIPVKVIGVDTIREASGLAMSSRNTYLSENEKYDASIIYKAFVNAKALIVDGEKEVKTVKDEIEKNISLINCRIEYIEAINIDSFEAVSTIDEKTLFAVAIHINKTRLIDNFFVKDITEI